MKHLAQKTMLEKEINDVRQKEVKKHNKFYIWLPFRGWIGNRPFTVLAVFVWVHNHHDLKNSWNIVVFLFTAGIMAQQLSLFSTALKDAVNADQSCLRGAVTSRGAY